MLQTFKKLPELAALLAFLVLSLVFFALTNPESLPPAVLILGFGLLAGVIYCTVRLAARLVGLKQRVSKGVYSGIMTAATILPVVLLALKSLGQLTARDIVTLIILTIASYIYISRMRSD